MSATRTRTVPRVRPVPMMPVVSDCFTHIGYNVDTRDLKVIFNSEIPGVYVYENVPPELFIRFLQSDSKGRFYHMHIRGQFESENLV